MASGKLELFDDYRETGFDGKYEHSTYYRLIGNEDGTVTLERDLAKLIQANDTRSA